jgi:hypothetical protein
MLFGGVGGNEAEYDGESGVEAEFNKGAKPKGKPSAAARGGLFGGKPTNRQPRSSARTSSPRLRRESASGLTLEELAEGAAKELLGGKKVGEASAEGGNYIRGEGKESRRQQERAEKAEMYQKGMSFNEVRERLFTLIGPSRSITLTNINDGVEARLNKKSIKKVHTAEIMEIKRLGGILEEAGNIPLHASLAPSLNTDNISKLFATVKEKTATPTLGVVRTLAPDRGVATHNITSSSPKSKEKDKNNFSAATDAFAADSEAPARAATPDQLAAGPAGTAPARPSSGLRALKTPELVRLAK